MCLTICDQKVFGYPISCLCALQTDLVRKCLESCEMTYCIAECKAFDKVVAVDRDAVTVRQASLSCRSTYSSYDRQGNSPVKRVINKKETGEVHHEGHQYFKRHECKQFRADVNGVTQERVFDMVNLHFD